MRSPSPPPPRNPHGLPSLPPRRDPRYRDDSPPPFRGQRGPYDSRPRGGYYESSRSHPRERERESYRMDDRDPRDPDRSWATYRARRDDPRDEDRDRRDSYNHGKGYDDRLRREESSRQNSRRGSPRPISRSASPEEGQITSPALPIRPTRSPLPLPRRRSPSPPRGSYRYPYPRDRERDRDYRRPVRSPERNVYPPRRRLPSRSRSPFSPPRSFPQSRRDTSPSSISSRSPSRSSRHTSPRKRFQSPDKRSMRDESLERRYRSPDKRPRILSPDRGVGNTSVVGGIIGRGVNSLPTRQASQGVTSTATGVPGRPFMPPSAPRSERLGLLGPSPGGPGGIHVPTGPRALSATNPYSTGFNRRPTTFTKQEDKEVPTAITGPTGDPPIKEEVSSNMQSSSTPLPIPRASPSHQFPIVSPTNSRLSWSERKKVSLSPSSSSKFTATTPLAEHATPTSSNSLNVGSSHNSNPYTTIKNTDSPLPRSETPLPPQQKSEPMDIKESIALTSIAEMKELEPGNRNGGKPQQTRLTEFELAELKAQEEEINILSELPTLKIPFGGAQWELDLAKHHQTLQTMQQSLFRSQALSRHAATVLADAEAERLAAMDRRRIVESQLGLGSLVGGVVGGILGV